jgi:hypothetical protein
MQAIDPDKIQQRDLRAMVLKAVNFPQLAKFLRRVEPA